MGKALLQFAAALMWSAASVFVVATGPSDATALRLLAAAIVATPAAIGVALSIGQLAGYDSHTRRALKRELKSSLIDLHRRIKYGDDITKVTFHVWVLPRWYRRLPAKACRGPLRSPRLLRVAMYRFQRQGSSRIKFRKGMGLIGRCMEANNKDVVMIVRFNRPDFTQALATDGKWMDSDIEINQGLTRNQAQELVKLYSQAAARVLQDPDGNAIGCVTMGLPPNCSVEFSGVPGDPLVELLQATGDRVQDSLTSRN